MVQPSTTTREPDQTRPSFSREDEKPDSEPRFSAGERLNTSMSRRTLVKRLGVLVCGVALSDATLAVGLTATAKEEVIEPVNRLPRSVAGIPLVSSKIAREATILSHRVSPPYLFNHALRTYVFGSMVGRALKQSFDEEVLYLACVFHDLGLTDHFMGDRPFEIQGAEAAKKFLEENGYAEDRIGVVWDGIAMHASIIGQYKQPEIALVGVGAEIDVVGSDLSTLEKTDIDEVLRVFPRLKLKSEFVRTCADVVRRHPETTGRTFMRDIAQRYVSDFHSTNICDAIAASPFAE